MRYHSQECVNPSSEKLVISQIFDQVLLQKLLTMASMPPMNKEWQSPFWND